MLDSAEMFHDNATASFFYRQIYRDVRFTRSKEYKYKNIQHNETKPQKTPHRDLGINGFMGQHHLGKHYQIVPSRELFIYRIMFHHPHEWPMEDSQLFTLVDGDQKSFLVTPQMKTMDSSLMSLSQKE